MEKILLVCDSRGRGLEEALYEVDRSTEWVVEVYKGKGLKDIANQAIRSSYKRNYTTIVLMGGICDITKLDRRGKEIRVRHTEKEIIVERLLNEIEPAVEMLRSMTGRVIIASTYGIELRRYNMRLFRTPGRADEVKSREKQVKIEQTIDWLNKEIVRFNMLAGLPTIRVDNKLHHRRKNGTLYANYKLLEDGCHPGREHLAITAKVISDTLMRINSRNEKRY